MTCRLVIQSRHPPHHNFGLIVHAPLSLWSVEVHLLLCLVFCLLVLIFIFVGLSCKAMTSSLAFLCQADVGTAMAHLPSRLRWEAIPGAPWLSCRSPTSFCHAWSFEKVGKIDHLLVSSAIVCSTFAMLIYCGLVAGHIDGESWDLIFCWQGIRTIWVGNRES